MTAITVKINGEAYEVEVIAGGRLPGVIRVSVNGVEKEVRLPEPLAPGRPPNWVIIDQRSYELAFDPDMRRMRANHQGYELEVHEPGGTAPRQACGDGRVLAPIPGVIRRVMAAVGDLVEAGQPLLVLEAMKMENEIRAPRSGRVSAVKVNAGQTVVLREVLLTID